MTKLEIRRINYFYMLATPYIYIYISQNRKVSKEREPKRRINIGIDLIGTGSREGAYLCSRSTRTKCRSLHRFLVKKSERFKGRGGGGGVTEKHFNFAGVISRGCSRSWAKFWQRYPRRGDVFRALESPRQFHLSHFEAK